MTLHHHTPGGCCSCAAHCFNRRGFLHKCGTAAAAGSVGLGALASARAASTGKKKARVGLVYICAPEGVNVWPYVNFDYEGRKQHFSSQLVEGCPELEFVPLSVQGSAGKEIPRVKKLAQEVDGLLVIPLCTNWGLARKLFRAVSDLNMPTVIADDPYSGSGVFLCYFADIKRRGSKAVGVSSCRFQDVIDVTNCFRMLAKEGTTVDAFAAKAQQVNEASWAKHHPSECKDDPVQVADISGTLKRLRGSKILRIGSGRAKSYEMYGVPIVQMGFDELNNLSKKVDPDEAAEWARRWADEAQEVVEPTTETLKKSAAIYLAMTELMKRHEAEGITINCLGGFYSGKLDGYPCLGYRQLNDDGGRMGTCEAKNDDMLSILMCKHLLGRAAFASDPVLDTSTGQIIYAHCVAPTKMLGFDQPGNAFRIRSHAEDNKGASLQSLLPAGYMTTTFDIEPRRNLMVTHRAKSSANIDEPRACRTKLAAEVQGDLGRMFDEWDRTSWHRVTVFGDVQEPIEEMGRAMGLKIVREA